MAPALEPAIVTRLLAALEIHGTAASELYLVLHAIRGAARVLTALVACLSARQRPAF